MGKQVAQVKIPLIKDYRATRDALFADLAKCEHGCDAYNDIRSKIYELDYANEEHIDEGCVTAQSLNFGDIKRTFQNVPKNLGIDPRMLQDSIRGEFQHIITEMAAPIAKQAFRTSAGLAKKTYESMKRFKESKPNLVEAINELGISVSLSVITLHYNGFYTRAEGLCRLLEEQASHFQFNRHSIRWILSNTGPDSIDINISGELFTSAFSAGVGVHAPLDLMIELVDEALAHAGVAE